MTLRISGKHMDIGDAFRTRINDRVGEVIDKYFDRGFSGQIVVVKSGSRYTADCMIRLDSGFRRGGGSPRDPPAPLQASVEVA
jgi:ribosome-associated translation inhibitor RaiA